MINIVLYEPEIPTNTGNIMRTCNAFDVKLHLIEPLGFYLDEKHLKRSAMDYINELDFEIHRDYNAFKNMNNDGQFIYFSRYGLKSFDECVFDINKDIYLVFGKESTGIDKTILKENIDNVYRLPMIKDARSLNLSNCVAIASYECLRQIGFPNLAKKEVIKGEDYLLKYK